MICLENQPLLCDTSCKVNSNCANDGVGQYNFKNTGVIHLKRILRISLRDKHIQNEYVQNIWPSNKYSTVPFELILSYNQPSESEVSSHQCIRSSE
jgi:hypothetical protein